MKTKTIGILLIMSVLMIICVGAISAADTNETLLEEVSDTNIETMSFAYEQGNAASHYESETGNDVEEISADDNRDEISSQKAGDASSNSNDDLLKASEDSFTDNTVMSDALNDILGSDSKRRAICIDGDTCAEFDTTAGSGDKNRILATEMLSGEVLKISPNVNVSDVVINYAQKINVNVTVDVADYYTVFLGNKSLTLYVEDNAIFTFASEDLKPDSYEITVHVLDHDEPCANASLTVNKVAGLFYLQNELIEYSENATVTVRVPVNAYGNITYEIYDGYVDLVYSATQSCLEELVVPNLGVGRYMVTGTFEGDSYYTNSSRVITSIIFVITKGVDLNISASNISYGENATVNVESDVDGNYLVYVGERPFMVTVINGTGSVPVPNLSAGIYAVNVTVTDENYSGFDSATFEVSKSKSEVAIDFDNETSSTSSLTLNLPPDAGGNVSLYVNDILSQTVNVTNGSAVIIISDLNIGNNNVTVVYSGDGNYASVTKSFVINRKPTVEAYDMTRGYNSGLDYTAKLFDGNGTPLANADVAIKVNTNTYTVKTDSNGVLNLNKKLAVGNYVISIVNPVTGEYKSTNLKVVKRIAGNKNLKIFFADGSNYKVRVIGDNGMYVGAGVTVKINVGGKTYFVKTNKNGYANLKLRLKVKKHTITVTYKGFTTKNKVTVKSVVKPVKKTVTVKRIAKKLLIKVKLKGKKVIKKKRVYLKFKGKTYKAKTNRKGIATFKVPKKVIKKLKKGKKYKAVFTYKAKANGKTIKNIAKCYVKVKK